MPEVKNVQKERDKKDKQCTGGARRAKGAGYAHGRIIVLSSLQIMMLVYR